MQNGLMQVAIKAQRNLLDLIKYLEVEVHGDDIEGRGRSGSSMQTAWSDLDQMLGCKDGIPRGATIEVISSPDYDDVFEFALSWARACQNEENMVGLIDPFNEFDHEYMAKTKLIPAQTVIFNDKNSKYLVETVLEMIGRNIIDLLIIPPGVIDQKWLADRDEKQLMTEKELELSFNRAIAALSWKARRTNTTLLILSENVNTKISKSAISSDVRMRITSIDSRKIRFIRIEHNAFDPGNIGKIVRIPQKRNKSHKM